MNRHDKPRDAASEAIIALRDAMGKTQQRFAVEELDCAVNSQARYETTHPPRGPLLLKLASIAEREKHFELRDKFRRLYMDEALAGKGIALASFTFLPANKDLPEGQTMGRLTLDLTTVEEVTIAQSFLAAISGLRSADPKLNKVGRAATASLAKADKILEADPALASDIRALVDGDPLQPSSRFRLSGEGKK